MKASSPCCAGWPGVCAPQSGTTALTEAAKAGNAEMLKLLVDRGADTEARDSVRLEEAPASRPATEVGMAVP